MESFNLENWLNIFQDKLKKIFDENLLFVGFHGSYRRGEATENSDIDTVVILKNMKTEDLKIFKSVIKSMPYSEKCCGFISSEKEIKNWSKTDIFQFYHETKNLYGDLKKIINPPPTENDIKTAIKINAENLYHAANHCFLYDKNIKESLVNLYKMTFFILQAKYYVESNEYILTKSMLLEKLSDNEKEILKTCINRNSILNLDLNEVETLHEQLTNWVSSLI